MRYEVYTMDEQFVADSKISKEDAVNKAKAKCDDKNMIGVIINDDGSERGGFLVGNVPF